MCGRSSIYESTRNISHPVSTHRIMNNSSKLFLRGCIRHPRKRLLLPYHISRRTFSLFPKKKVEDPASTATHPLEQDSKYLRLSQDNLFHPLISSPIVNIRKKAMAIKSLAVCPTSGLLERNEYTCPNCGFPTHCSEEHYRLDQERHERESCDTLRQINEDLHDMQSGRQFPEFTLRRKL
jgi:mitochondrial splicing suppressor protein 51